MADHRQAYGENRDDIQLYKYNYYKKYVHVLSVQWFNTKRPRSGVPQQRLDFAQDLTCYVQIIERTRLDSTELAAGERVDRDGCYDLNIDYGRG